jgi:hypothetical protein
MKAKTDHFHACLCKVYVPNSTSTGRHAFLVVFLLVLTLTSPSSIHEGDNMRKILLATTALVGVVLAGASQAAPASPISLNVGGYDDFVAGFFHEASGVMPTGTRTNGKDFENEFKLSFDATGKASNGVEYGANIGLWNGSEVTNLWSGGGNGVVLNSGYVWMSGAFGKVLFGDEHGASDLFVYAPTVGEGQVDGRYRDFVEAQNLAFFQASGIDNTEHSTKITYYTPKVGNDSNKVQLGVSYIPTLYNYGQSAVLTQSSSALTGNANSPYTDVVKGAVQYTGSFHPVDLTASAQVLTGSSSHNPLGATTLGGALGGGVSGSASKAQDFTAWGVGLQAGFSGLTLGASYTDQGRYNTIHGQNKAQDIASIGAKYEFDKVGVGANWLTGQGYADYLTGGAGTTANLTDYVRSWNAEGVGATYTWFPGLTSAIDGVMFQQKVSNITDHNDGYVVLLAQKLTF